jgi:hypothetical protein
VDDLTDLLTRACQTAPSDVDVSAAREYQAYGEAGLAVDALADLDTGWQPPPAWWDLLIGAADLMRMGATAGWCRWRRWESLHGVIRASLELTAGGPTPGRLFFDIGRPDPRAARVRVEFAPSPGPGEIGTVRLAPLTPADWRDLRPGDRITIHDRSRLEGTATILETRQGLMGGQGFSASGPGPGARRS